MGERERHHRDDGYYCCGDETVAMRKLMEAFPRGRFRDGSIAAPDASVVRKSWELLVAALSLARAELPRAATAGGRDRERTVDIDPEDFPLLLSRRSHEDVVGGLAANLMRVEVRRTGGAGRGRKKRRMHLITVA